MRPRRRTSSGAAAVEFALVLPVFLTVLFGMIEYGWFFYQQYGVASAVREGARMGVTIDMDATPDPRDAAKTRTKAVLDAVGISYTGGTVNAVYTGSYPNRTLNVNVDVNYKALLNFVPTPKKLSYKLTMFMELQEDHSPPP